MCQIFPLVFKKTIKFELEGSVVAIVCCILIGERSLVFTYLKISIYAAFLHHLHWPGLHVPSCLFVLCERIVAFGKSWTTLSAGGNRQQHWLKHLTEDNRGQALTFWTDTELPNNFISFKCTSVQSRQVPFELPQRKFLSAPPHRLDGSKWNSQDASYTRSMSAFLLQHISVSLTLN